MLSLCKGGSGFGPFEGRKGRMFVNGGACNCARSTERPRSAAPVGGHPVDGSMRDVVWSAEFVCDCAWGRDHDGPMGKMLGFTREQTPAHSTLHEVFKRLDRQAFERALGSWLQERGLKEGEAVAIDGKTLRGIHGEELPGVHLVSAFAHQTGIIVGQRPWERKGMNSRHFLLSWSN